MTPLRRKVSFEKLGRVSVAMSSAFLKSLWKATVTVLLLSSAGMVAKVLVAVKSRATRANVLIASDIYLGFIV